MTPPPFNAALIIPTGVGASIGGFGGDGMTLLPLFASVCDTLITHPNVANAACFQTLPENTLYVEGFALDQFFRGVWSLQPVRQNRIGVIWDAGIPPEMEILHRNTLAAVQTVYGINLLGVEITREPVALELTQEDSGRSAGTVSNPAVLLEAGRKLLADGATALAVCCLMPVGDAAEADSAYKAGSGIDPIGGIEAMISHHLVAELQVPVAHVPVFPLEDALPVTDALLDPRAASEFIVSTFLPCVLTGLHRAPQYAVEPSNITITLSDLSALVVPADALGSIPVLSALENNIPILAVENNTTVINCTAEALGLSDRVIPCATYLEALGWLVALKSGLHLPPHITQKRVEKETFAYAKA